MGRIVSFFLTLGVAVGLAGATVAAHADTTTTSTVHHRKTARRSTHKTRPVARTRLVRGRDGKLHRVSVRRRYYEHFTGDSFAQSDITAGDNTAG